MDSSRFESLTGTVGLDFPEYDAPPDRPLGLVRRWLAEATERGVREPRSMALATSDRDGRASNRMVTVTRLDDAGLVFSTHATSRKGREMEATGWASGLLYWRETSQQVVLSGPVARLGDEESDALWAARPVPLHPMSHLSHQSEPLGDAEALRGRARRLEAAGAPLPRPARFAGYLLGPESVEFWSAAPDRLHRRLRYDRDAGEAEGWRVTRLQP
ncbi:phenazine biosynthesis FMN-dependent oxidase PhzG [Streptomyces marincola]|uniref:phenazine biosynthesis FMN-dependent oxidase PhzG n=1 Tax=Streptomyces marincola TaxID=2878388 RepID=UPI001CF58E5F|nr:phenazine biosynthesis FMN-dependent oxidase PhzG [Streptomyces marincola]UCM91524.1 phenazine biosynthesis FMN-dependent oxidase PhzG [Streptomyces marincola]